MLLCFIYIKFREWVADNDLLQRSRIISVSFDHHSSQQTILNERYLYLQTFFSPEDSLWYHDGMFFSTYDNDNDNRDYNCGSRWRGGWWYNACHRANLNGDYGNTKFGEGINWYYWKGFYYTMREVRMMVRKPQG